MSRSVLLEQPGRHRLVKGEVPTPGAGEVLVRVAAAGICGSDRELYEGGRPEAYRTFPIVPGHEWSGTVADVGPGVDPALIGLPTVGEGFVSCQTCVRCREGDTNLCHAGYDEIGFTRPGAFADHLIVPARLLHPLPPGTDLRAAVLLEPAAVAAAAVLRAAPLPGERVGVVGAGTLGLLTIQLLAASSPAELVVSDPRAGREPVARAGGATAYFHPDELGELDLDVVVETAGARDSAAAAARQVRKGGRLVLTGIPGVKPEMLSPSMIVGRQLTITSVFGASSAAWAHAVRAFNAGLLDLGPLVTHELPLEDYPEAVALLGRGGDDVGKIILKP
ncbi:zinc-dependent alcohol dehydrogenase [Actinoallomurus soli]|uniref:zinc-dependent alcohol dehydrogenase n=1 Tax=Actinoallomurus soli TaxID=2952535 RepID=UPI002092BDAD|nr:alcohol dehydrogenase catalytic domain-containing protein [Actinoallomurus soli]MCO5969001.1 alcohol dehydrogenase catalytic domain-containing protein [Actinoallomurus soli]